MSFGLSRLRLAVAALLVIGCGHAAGAQDFYKDKTITIMVPSGTASSMGMYGRMLAAGLEKYIPGHPTVILQERPGAGGVTGTSYAFNAGPTDGTYLAMLSAGNIILPMIREGLQYDVKRMQWIGSIAVRPSVLWVWNTVPVNSIEDAKTKEVVLGSTGRGSGMSVWPRLLNMTLGTKFRVVEGYKGGADIDLAAERGELHGRWTSYTALTAAKPDWVPGKLVKVLVTFGPRIAEHKGVPGITDLVKGDDQKIVRFMELSEAVGLGFWVHPDVPKDRIAILRKAMADVVNDPTIRADGEKRGAPVEPLSADQIEKLVNEAYSLTPAQVQRVRAIFGTGKS
jgi:tripartite-type tricarboxylate transporter receptor subunit TctC